MSHAKFAKCREHVLDALHKGTGLKRAAELAGVTPRAVYQWIERGEADIKAGKRTKHAEFAEQVGQERARTGSLMERAVVGHAVKDWRAAAWWLERSLPEEYGRHDKVTVEVKQAMAAELMDHFKEHLDAETYSRVLACLRPDGGGEADPANLN